MKILNLTNSEQSEIKYKISKFPDGQQNITILSSVNRNIPMDNGISLGSMYKYCIQIKSRLNNFKDLELIVCAVACLRELGVKEIHLFVPYFVGARSDRKFEEGGNWYLKQVICPIINSLNLTSITVIDPHSSVLGNLLNNFKSIDNEQLVRFALDDIYEPSPSIRDFILVAPDSGASHKIYKLAEKIGYKRDIIICSKERDTEGKLTKTVVPIPYKEDGYFKESWKDYIIIDDICDGGRTFINISSEIKNYRKKYLIITHGIFSNGFSELSKHFDGIYCTNSFSNIGDYAGNDQEKTNIKQINVF